MPCACKSVPARFLDLIHVVRLSDFMSDDEIKEVEEGAKDMHWNHTIPGGFIHNSPQRQVNAFGDGSGYDTNLIPVGKAWDISYWTGAVHQSDVTIVTRTQKMPLWLMKLGLKCRILVTEKYNITMTEHAFNLAVCNLYANKKDEIAAHTDDNEWYTKDLEDGPMFASLTLYPDTTPLYNSEYARFEVFVDDAWVHYALPHASILLMPSCIPHRVRPVAKDQPMHRRINVTLRSVPSVELDPLNSLLGVSNHTRYYKPAEEMIIAADKPINGHVADILKAFSKCLAKNDSHKAFKLFRSDTKTKRQKDRQAFKSQLKKAKLMTSHIKANVVNELLSAVLSSR